MHYRAEVIMPKTDDIESKLEKVMARFEEGQEPDEDGYTSPHVFWDYYVIGGRWKSQKLTDRLDKDKVDLFYKEMNEKNVKVHGLRAGKPKLADFETEKLVDKMWNRHFLEMKMEHCPFFEHSGSQFEDNAQYPDVMPFKDVDHEMKCERIIFASHEFNAEYMLSDSVYNGVNFIDTEWDGSFGSALRMYSEYMGRYGKEWREKIKPQEDWNVITIDYHS